MSSNDNVTLVSFIIAGIVIIKLISPVFFYSQIFVSKARRLDTTVFKWLVRQDVLFGSLFNASKIFFFVINLFIFAQVSVGFYFDVLKLEGDAFYCAVYSIFFFQLFLVYNVGKIMFDVYSRKFIYVDEIFQISVMTLFTTISSLLSQEFAFLPLKEWFGGTLKEWFWGTGSSKGSTNSENSKDPGMETVYMHPDPPKNASNSEAAPNSEDFSKKNSSFKAASPVEPNVVSIIPSLISTIPNQNDNSVTNTPGIMTDQEVEEAMSPAGLLTENARIFMMNSVSLCRKTLEEAKEPEGVDVCYGPIPAQTDFTHVDFHTVEERKNQICSVASLVVETYTGKPIPTERIPYVNRNGPLPPRPPSPSGTQNITSPHQG